MPVSTIPLASAVSGTLPDGSAPSGSVIQVVSSVLTSQVSSTATSYTNIGLSASITPTSASNKILAIVNIGMVNTNTNAGSFLAIFRGANILSQGDASSSRQRTMSGSMFSSADNSGSPMTMVFLDSPNTTSSTTYDVRGANLENTLAWYINRSRNNENTSYGFTSVSTITLMEIAA